MLPCGTRIRGGDRPTWPHSLLTARRSRNAHKKRTHDASEEYEAVMEALLCLKSKSTVSKVVVSESGVFGFFLFLSFDSGQSQKRKGDDRERSQGRSRVSS